MRELLDVLAHTHARRGSHRSAYRGSLRTRLVTMIGAILTTLASVAVMLLIIALLFLTTVPTEAGAQGRRDGADRRANGGGGLAVVDIDLLVDSAPQRPEAERRYADQVREAERLVQAVTDSLRLTLDDFSRQQSRITRAQREAAMHVLRAREIQLEDMVQQLELAMERERTALRAPIVDEVRHAIREVRLRDGWSAIVDRRALGEVFEIDATHDVTSRVLEVMRQRFRRPAGTAGQGPGSGTRRISTSGYHSATGDGHAAVAEVARRSPRTATAKALKESRREGQRRGGLPKAFLGDLRATSVTSA